jgi:hypothetical protein
MVRRCSGVSVNGSDTGAASASGSSVTSRHPASVPLALRRPTVVWKKPATAVSATKRMTSLTAIGWMSAGGTRTVTPCVSTSTIC